MNIGNYRIDRIDAGRFRLDGGAMFGVVPKPLWERKKPADSANRINMGANLLLMRNDQRNILIDTGLGDKFSEKLAKIYAVDNSDFSLAKGLQNLGLTSADITDVILTHLHFDHAGGATFYDPQGHLQPTFGNARHYIQKAHLEWALNPTERDTASFFAENIEPLLENKLLETVEGETELFPQIRLIPVHGHTPAQQMVLIGDDRQSLLFAGDLVPTSAHVPLPWIMGYDLHPLTILEEKRKYLSNAAEFRRLVFFEHDPEKYCAYVEVGERGLELGEVVRL